MVVKGLVHDVKSTLYLVLFSTIFYFQYFETLLKICYCIAKRPEMPKELAHGANVQLLLIILANPHPANQSQMELRMEIYANLHTFSNLISFFRS